MHRLPIVTLMTLAAMCLAQSAGARVLRVGAYHGIKGQYSSIQAAVAAAKPGDWILVGPGDYKTHSSQTATTKHPASDFPAAILVTKPDIRIRGMNRNTVIVDGTKAGPPCNHTKADQNFGPKTKSGRAGLNGIMVWKADNVWVQNLTACNFLSGSGDAGNEIWWNGGANSGGYTKVRIGGWGYNGSYLTATSSWYDARNGSKAAAAKAEATAAAYGIFSSNWSGGTWDHDYASNFNDSGFYIGACGQKCDQVVNHVWSEWNALGYSGSNSGGRLLVENSQWDHNEDGFDTNSQEGDNPPPQNGSCPKGVKPPVKGAHTCWVFFHNYVHDNNDPNVPTAGLAGGGPVGTGMSISGGRFDTVMDNRFVHNGAWGNIVVPFPGSGPPCTGGQGTPPGYSTCIWDPYGVAVVHNTYSKNGFYGNQTNGDIGLSNFYPNEPTDCFIGNHDTDGHLTTAPSKAQKMYPKCHGKMSSPSLSTSGGSEFTLQVACDSTINIGPAGKAPCPPGSHYPRVNYQKIHNGLHPLPSARKLPSMSNPCSGVPANPWCPSRQHHSARGAVALASVFAAFTG
jgi:hypothetical protein